MEIRWNHCQSNETRFNLIKIANVLQMKSKVKANIFLKPFDVSHVLEMTNQVHF